MARERKHPHFSNDMHPPPLTHRQNFPESPIPDIPGKGGEDVWPRSPALWGR
jgi:hypothetical protein